MNMHVEPRHRAPEAPVRGGPQHAIGRGRYRLARPFRERAYSVAGIAGGLAVGLGALAYGLGAVGHGRTAEAAPVQSVIVELAAPEQQGQVLDAASSTCGSLNLGALDAEDSDQAAAEAIDAYETLQASIAHASQVEETSFLLEDVPQDVLDSYQAGTVPLRKLFAAATVVTLTPKDQAEDTLELPKVTAPLPRSSIDQVQTGVQRLDQALQVLPVEELLAVAGPDAIDVASLSDADIDTVLAAQEVQSFRTEKDRRQAAVLPDLSGVTNGHLDPGLLCPISWSGDQQVLCAALPYLERLNAAFAAQFGHDLVITSGYRSYEQQVAAHEQSPNMTTLPGTSNHSWGLAVDFDMGSYATYDNPEVAWLVENAPAFQWRNPTLEALGTADAEPWHFEFGTAYPGLQDSGFHGPAPDVEFIVSVPDGWRTQTLKNAE